MDDSLSINQLVAANIARARTRLGITQEELGKRLSSRTGRQWSKVNISAAERSVDGKRARKFDAEELLAFAEALEVPLDWLFLPDGAEDPDAPRYYAGQPPDDPDTPRYYAGNPEPNWTPREVVAVLFSEDGPSPTRADMMRTYRERVRDVEKQWGGLSLLMQLGRLRYSQEAKQQLAEQASNVLRELREEVGRLDAASARFGDWIDTLDQLEQAVREGVASDDASAPDDEGEQ